jgi:hypothetical protein
MIVYVVMERAAESPDSVWLDEASADKRAAKLGAPDDAAVFDFKLPEEVKL